MDLVHRICQEVVEDPDVRRMRYVNRLTPVTVMAKANEKGLEELTAAVLQKHFQLSKEHKTEEVKTPEEQSNTTSHPSVSGPPPFFVLSHSLEEHRVVPIRTIADLV